MASCVNISTLCFLPGQWHRGRIHCIVAALELIGPRGESPLPLGPVANDLVSTSTRCLQVMYSHYLATSAFTFQKIWWCVLLCSICISASPCAGPHTMLVHRKPLITSVQMGHHVLCMFYMVSNFYIGNPECTLCVSICRVSLCVMALALMPLVITQVSLYMGHIVGSFYLGPVCSLFLEIVCFYGQGTQRSKIKVGRALK